MMELKKGGKMRREKRDGSRSSQRKKRTVELFFFPFRRELYSGRRDGRDGYPGQRREKTTHSQTR